MEQGDSLIVMDNKPKKAPPARFAAKNTASNDDIPIKPAKNVDDMPIGGASQPPPMTGDDEDKPIARGTYDLDKLLGADAFADPNADLSTAKVLPKKQPPARFAAKKPADTTKNNEDVPIKAA